MPNDPLALPEILSSPADVEADYDAAHAAIIATERGRRFLDEYAARNRRADTQNLIDAIARAASAPGNNPPAPAAADLCRDLAEIAAAVGRIEAESAAGDAGNAPAPALFAAVERIQDIAFVLHERPVEPTLCDGLDAAVREIADAGARLDGAAARAGKADDLLHGLATRIGEVLARLIAERDAKPPAAVESRVAAAGEDDGPQGVMDDDGSPRASVNELEAQQDETFAQAVAALAASLPTPDDEPELPLEGQSEVAEVIAAPLAYGDEVPAEETSSQHAPGEAQPGESVSTEPPAAGTIATEELPEEEASGASMSGGRVSDYGLSNDAMPAGPDTNESKTAAEHAAENDAELPAAEAAPHAPLPEPERSVGPEEDPGDLFELEPNQDQPAAAPTPSAPVGLSPPAQSSAPPAGFTGGPPPRGPTRAPLSDPLAAVAALSEEELIALFS